MVTYIAVAIMVLMGLLEVIFLNGIFVCIAIVALTVALLSLFHVPYIIVGIVAVIELAIGLIFLRPFLQARMKKSIEETNKKFEETNAEDEAAGEKKSCDDITGDAKAEGGRDGN